MFLLKKALMSDHRWHQRVYKADKKKANYAQTEDASPTLNESFIKYFMQKKLNYCGETAKELFLTFRKFIL